MATGFRGRKPKSNKPSTSKTTTSFKDTKEANLKAKDKSYKLKWISIVIFIFLFSVVVVKIYFPQFFADSNNNSRTSTAATHSKGSQPVKSTKKIDRKGRNNYQEPLVTQS